MAENSCCRLHRCRITGLRVRYARIGDDADIVGRIDDVEHVSRLGRIEEPEHTRAVGVGRGERLTGQPLF